MPIAPYRHEEDPSWFIVQTPNREWSGKRCGVTFVEGEGWTDDEAVARELDETYGYTVILGAGAKKWETAAPPEKLVVHKAPYKDQSATPAQRAKNRNSKDVARESAEAEQEALIAAVAEVPA